MAWRFSESNRAWNDRLKHDLAEVLLHLPNHLLSKVVPHEHRHEDAADVKIWVSA